MEIMKKVKVKITEEEWYPLYDINTNRTYTVMKVEIPEEKADAWGENAQIGQRPDLFASEGNGVQRGKKECDQPGD